MAGGTQNIGTLQVIIGANFQKLINGLAQSRNAIQKNVAQLKGASGGFRQMGMAATAAGAAIVGMGYGVMKTFGQFEQSMANAGSVMGVTSAEMKKVSDFAREMGATSVFTASEAADAMYYLAIAGYNVNQVMGALPGTLALAAATGSGLAETTEITVATLKSFNMEAEEAGRVSNVFAAAISGSMASMEKIGNSMKYIAPIANTFGIEVEQTAAALGQLFNAGMEGSQAGVYLRQSLLALAKPTNQAEESLAKYGLTAADLDPVNNDLVQIIDKLTKAGMNNGKAMGDLAAIFGKRAAPAMKILLSTGAQGLKAFETQITGTNKASKMAEMQINTLEGSIKLMKSALQETAIQFGEALVPVIRGVIDRVKVLATWFNNLPAGFKKVIAVAGLLVGGLLALAGPIGMLLAALPAIAAALPMIATAMGALMGPVGLAIVGITALGAAILSAAGAEDRMLERQKKAITKQQEYVSAQMQAKESVAAMAEEYEMLASQSERTEEEQARLAELHEAMRRKYPEIITKTEDYAGAIDQIRAAAAEAKGELSELSQRQRDLNRASANLSIVEANKKKREAIDDFSDALTDNIKVAQLLKTGQSQIKEIFGKYAETIKKESGVFVTTSGITKGFELSDIMKNALDQAKKGNTEALDQIAQFAANASNELAKLEQQPRMSLQTQVMAQELSDMIDVLTEASDAGYAAAEAAQAHADAQQRLKDLRMGKDKEGGAGTTQKTAEEIQAEIEAAAEAEEKRKAAAAKAAEQARKLSARRAELIAKLTEEEADAEIQALEAKAQRTLAEEEALAMLRNKKNVATIQREGAKMAEQHAKAGLGVAKVEALTNKKLEAEEQRHQEELKSIRENYDLQEIDTGLVRLKQQERVNAEDIAAYKATLLEKQNALEASGVTSGAVYNKIIKTIAELDKLVTDSMKKDLDGLDNQIKLSEAKMKEALKAEGGPDLGAYKAAADEMTTLLQQRLDLIKTMYGENSVEYLDMLQWMREHNNNVFETMNADTKYWADKISDMFVDSFGGAFDEWVKSGEAASIQLKSVFDSVKQGFRQMIVDMIAQAAKKSIFDPLAKSIGSIFASIIPGGSIIGSLFSSAVGGYTAGGGLQNLHPGEGLVANVRRRNSSVYAAAVTGAGGAIGKVRTGGTYYTPGGTTVVPRHVMNKVRNSAVGGIVGDGPIVSAGAGGNAGAPGISDSFARDRSGATPSNITLNVQGAVVNDQKYWDKLYNDMIVPAMNNAQKRHNG